MRWIILVSLCLAGLGASAQEDSADSEALRDEKISLNIEKEPVEAAMRMLAESAGVNVLLSPTIKGEVNAHIVDMEPRAALEQTILANGFYFVLHENVYSVMSSEEYFEDRTRGANAVSST
jgi:type II secretory pathway component GspD/PulD (secretin)